MGLLQACTDTGKYGQPDLIGIMFHPSGMTEDLRKLLLTGRNDMLVMIKENGPGTGRSLIDRHDIFFHLFLR